jgi:hypothetical protein
MRLADSELRSLKRKANYTRRKAPWQNESRRVGMKFDALVELSLSEANGM